VADDQTPADDQTQQPPAGSVVPPTPKADQPPATGGEEWADPAKAKAEIERLRRENGTQRVTAKQQAANEARQEFAKEVAQALGLAPKDDESPEQLRARIADRETAVREKDTQLAVFTLAASVTPAADAVKLLSWKPFLDSIAGIDPSNQQAVKDAMKAATDAHPFLRAAPVAGASAAQHAGGSSGAVTPSSTAAPGQARMMAAYGENAAAAH
jgi:hypothetical protein